MWKYHTQAHVFSQRSGRKSSMGLNIENLADNHRGLFCIGLEPTFQPDFKAQTDIVLHFRSRLPLVASRYANWIIVVRALAVSGGSVLSARR